MFLVAGLVWMLRVWRRYIYPDSARIRRPPLANGAIWILPNG